MAIGMNHLLVRFLKESCPPVLWQSYKDSTNTNEFEKGFNSWLQGKLVSWMAHRFDTFQVKTGHCLSCIPLSASILRNVSIYVSLENKTNDVALSFAQQCDEVFIVYLFAEKLLVINNNEMDKVGLDTFAKELRSDSLGLICSMWELPYFKNMCRTRTKDELEQAAFNEGNQSSMYDGLNHSFSTSVGMLFKTHPYVYYPLVETSLTSSSLSTSSNNWQWTSFKELTLFNTAHQSAIKVEIVTEICTKTGTDVYCKDINDQILTIACYNFLPPVLGPKPTFSTLKAAKCLFPEGTQFVIIEPFLKLPTNGPTKMIRIEDPRDVLIMNPKLLSVIDAKEEGNNCMKKKQYEMARFFYMKCLMKETTTIFPGNSVRVSSKPRKPNKVIQNTAQVLRNRGKSQIMNQDATETSAFGVLLDGVCGVVLHYNETNFNFYKKGLLAALNSSLYSFPNKKRFDNISQVSSSDLPSIYELMIENVLKETFTTIIGTDDAASNKRNENQIGSNTVDLSNAQLRTDYANELNKSGINNYKSKQFDAAYNDFTNYLLVTAIDSCVPALLNNLAQANLDCGRAHEAFVYAIAVLNLLKPPSSSSSPSPSSSHHPLTFNPFNNNDLAQGLTSLRDKAILRMFTALFMLDQVPLIQRMLEGAIPSDFPFLNKLQLMLKMRLCFVDHSNDSETLKKNANPCFWHIRSLKQIEKTVPFEWVNEKLELKMIDETKGRGVFCNQPIYKNEILFVSNTTASGRGSDFNRLENNLSSSDRLNTMVHFSKQTNSASWEHLAHEAIYRSYDDIDFAMKLSYLYDGTSYDTKQAPPSLKTLIDSGFSEFVLPALPPRQEFVLPSAEKDIFKQLQYQTSVKQLKQILSMNSFGGYTSVDQEQAHDQFSYKGHFSILYTAASMLNHSKTPNVLHTKMIDLYSMEMNKNLSVKSYLQQLESVSFLVAVKDIKVGEEVCTSYGVGSKLSKWGIHE